MTYRKRWGVVLAGGDGVRLRPLTRYICGDERPKQFCPVCGSVTLLEQARRRAQMAIRADHILFSLNRAHEDYYLHELWNCPEQRVVQPRNRGTAAAIVSSVLFIAHRDPDASVAIFPSDHHYSDENVVIDSVERAFAATQTKPDSLVLVGARPLGPETGYGWIELGNPQEGQRDVFEVRGFYEKPSSGLAAMLLEQGALWNTFVVVGRAIAFLEVICSAVPGFLRKFDGICEGRAPGEELRIPDPLYARIPSVDFSRQVLATETPRLLVNRLGSVAWSDLGDCRRAIEALTFNSEEPEWIRGWRSLQRIDESRLRADRVVLV